MSDDQIADLLNLGPKTASWLQSIGVLTRNDLEYMGTIDCC